MVDKTLLILDFVAEGKLSVDDALSLIELLEEAETPEIWVVPLHLSPPLEICLN